MSESFSAHSAEPINRRMPDDKVGASGRAVNGIERRVVDPESGREVPAGEVGELHLRGGALMTGFYKVDRREVFTPDGERIELFDETATNLGFTLDAGGKNEQAELHNRPLNGSVAFHHIHLYLPTGADAAAKKWYAETFGALPGKRWRYEAADLPGVNMNFSGSDKPGAPLEGRVLDHIGFEVKDLQAFCKRLEVRGTRIAVRYRKVKTGVASAMITDPWGTSIELTEGLSGLPP